MLLSLKVARAGWASTWNKAFDLNHELERRYIAVPEVLTKEQGEIILDFRGYECSPKCQGSGKKKDSNPGNLCIEGCRGERKQAGSKENSVLHMLQGALQLCGWNAIVLTEK
jgi:hypothetical protein